MSEQEQDVRTEHLPSATLATLQARHQLLKQLREFFDTRGFWEVTTPVLSQDTVVDEHLDPFQVVCYEDPRQWEHGPRRFLQTSPEFHMKRLLSAGAMAIYQIGPAFRAAECGPLHNPEFSMLEWYRVGDDLESGMQLLEQLVRCIVADAVERESYATAYQRELGLDPHRATIDELRRVAGGQLAEPAARDDLLHYLWNRDVAHRLGATVPTIVYDFPASQAALAQIRSGDPPVAERFELYWRGIELANGYHELRWATELRQRNLDTNARRQQAGKPRLPQNSALLAAMESGLPACAGVALGVDRLLMVQQGLPHIRQALSFDFPRA